MFVSFGSKSVPAESVVNITKMGRNSSIILLDDGTEFEADGSVSYHTERLNAALGNVPAGDTEPPSFDRATLLQMLLEATK